MFSQPPVGTVGLTEAFARLQCGAVDIYRTTFRPLKHTLSGRDEKTMMKLVVDRATQRVVGVHMVGLDAPEIVQSVAIAVKMGATKAAVRRHHGDPSDGGGGVRHPAHARAGAAEEEGGGVGRYRLANSASKALRYRSLSLGSRCWTSMVRRRQ